MKRFNSLLSDTESLIIFGAILFATFIFATIVNRFILRKLLVKYKDSKTDFTSFVFLKNIILLTIYLVGAGWAFLTLPITKNFAHSLFAGAGATTLIIGFASQQILSNLISGVFIIVNRPFKINDVIEIQGNNGKVIEINWHDTIIENENTITVIIPNSMISNSIIKVNKDKALDYTEK